MTSSKISTDLDSLVLDLISFKKFLWDLMKPIFPAIGSIITPARSSFTFSYNFINASSLLNSQLSVCFARSFGTPGESGKPKVVTPEPALIKRESL